MTAKACLKDREMADFTPLRGKLLTLRRKTLALLAERSEDTLTDAGLLALVANVQITLTALDEAEGRAS